jgi:hypothetical protein
VSETKFRVSSSPESVGKLLGMCDAIRRSREMSLEIPGCTEKDRVDELLAFVAELDKREQGHE